MLGYFLNYHRFYNVKQLSSNFFHEFSKNIIAFVSLQIRSDIRFILKVVGATSSNKTFLTVFNGKQSEYLSQISSKIDIMVMITKDNPLKKATIGIYHWLHPTSESQHATFTMSLERVSNAFLILSISWALVLQAVRLVSFSASLNT